jgi:hypothetical protein
MVGEFYLLGYKALQCDKSQPSSGSKNKPRNQHVVFFDPEDRGGMFLRNVV